MPTAAKAEKLPAHSDPPWMFIPLAAAAGVRKKSRPGFERKNAHQGSVQSNSRKALGLQAVAWENYTASYYRARYYDQVTGRFVSEDPLQFSAGYNFFVYVGNQPAQFSDPTGLFPTKFHYDLTYYAARAAFGNKCEPLARIVAQANADQDALHGFGQHVKFGLGVGDGWHRGSIHFGGPVDQSLRDAFTKCDDYALGRGLHGLQDDISHSGAYASPALHYGTSILSYLTLGIGGLNPADSLSNFAGVNAAKSATNSILRQYQRKCLNCCGSPR